MTRDERAAVLDGLSALSEYFDKALSEAQQAIYLQGLDDLPAPALLVAMADAVKTCTFMPKVAELRQIVQGTTSESGEASWHELLGEIRRVGAWRTGKLSPLTQATMERLCGSWEACCASIGHAVGNELLGWAKRWREAYDATRGLSERGELIGRAEAKHILASLTQQLPAARERDLPSVPERAQVAGDLHTEGRDATRPVLQPVRTKFPARVSGE